MLECATCHAKVPEEAARCPQCGERRLLAPPDLLQRREVLWGVYGGGAVLFVAWMLVVFGVYFLAFWDRALAFFGLSPTQVGAAERRSRLRDIVRDAELSVPAFPGATRLQERSTENRLDTAPVVESCWQAPAELESVLAFYRTALQPEPGAETGARGSWRIRRDVAGSGQLGAEQGQVRLLVHGPGAGMAGGAPCPPETTYVLSLTAFTPGR